MKYIAIPRSMLTSSPFAEAEEVAVAAWLRVHSYAAMDGHESPVISGCRTWSQRGWLTNCQTNLEAVEQAVAAGLCEWEGDDLVVLFYDEDGQRKVEQRRVNGGNGGRPPGPTPRRKTGTKPGGNRSETGDEPGGKANGNPSPLPSDPFPTDPVPSSPTPPASSSEVKW